jgi:hypothetical protein
MLVNVVRAGCNEKRNPRISLSFEIAHSDTSLPLPNYLLLVRVRRGQRFAIVHRELVNGIGIIVYPSSWKFLTGGGDCGTH